MLVPLSWLRDYVDITLSMDELAERLTMAGMEVSAIQAAGGEWTDVVVGRLLAVEPHPNAEKLTVTRVDAGDGEPLEIVCGAHNIAPGQLVPVARVGATLPGGRSIGRTKIRGIVSEGMLCSAAELGLGTDADGILILGTADEHRIGSALGEAVGDVVLDVDVKPNRGDALSMLGLAREVAALTGGELRLPPSDLHEEGDEAIAHVAIEIQDGDLCPRFTARYLEVAGNPPSPDWMQRRLVAAGMRPISTIVDVTNYVMHELGQPMHAYDADAIPSGRIVVRRARDGEELVTIDHERRRLDRSMLAIADAERAIGLAGIMGGADTEVTDRTRRVILESAIFHGPAIRATARRLGLRSEASSRHEKGISWYLPRAAADRAARLIREIGGGRVARGIVDNDPRPRPRREIAVDLERVERLLGLAVTSEGAGRLLEGLGFEVRSSDPRYAVVTVPPHRLDVTEPADVAEELARAHGYDRLAARLPSAPLPPFRADPSRQRHAVRRILAGIGLDEIVAHALIGIADLERTGYRIPAERLIRVANPVAEDHSVLRPVVYPSLLRALRDNVRQRRRTAWIFEVGKVYWVGSDEPTPREREAESAGTGRYEAWELGIALLGPRGPRVVGGEAPDADVDDGKGVVEALHRALGAVAPRFVQETDDRHPHLHPGRAARIVDEGGVAYGSVGEVDPRVATAWDLPGRPVIAAVSLRRLLDLIPASWRSSPVPGAQPVDRDLAVVVDDATPVGEVLSVVRRAAGPLLSDVRLFDIYRGEQIGAGRVSYALALRFQPRAAVEEAGVERALGKIQGALRHHVGGEVRA
ncbi:MAG: phenylalanine--tRNA ligase subunit beta [Candidatus Limnocylindria bacterium]